MTGVPEAEPEAGYMRKGERGKHTQSQYDPELLDQAWPGTDPISGLFQLHENSCSLLNEFDLDLPQLRAKSTFH